MSLDQWIDEMAQSDNWNQHKNQCFHIARMFREGLISKREWEAFRHYLADNNLEDFGLLGITDN